MFIYPNNRQFCKVRPREMTATIHATDQSLQVLIVDDHPVVLSGCRAILSQDASIHVVASGNAEAAFVLYQRHKPDVTVIDINLPGRSGFDLGHRILRTDPSAKLIFFSMNDDPIFAAKAIECGARGYVSKTDDPRDFLAAIREVASGGVFLASTMARKLAFRQGRTGANPLSSLSERDLEILRLMARGNTLAEIAETLGTSYKTVANTTSIMKRKLTARTPMDLVRIAVEHGLL
jgi:two-component system, NarL family, invasion response regulator UvrY